MASINPDEKVIFIVEHPVTTIMDKVSNAAYTYVSRSVVPSRSSAAAGWQCYRITNADGTLKFAQAVSGLISSTGAPLAVGRATDDFVFIADNAATYTY